MIKEDFKIFVFMDRKLAYTNLNLDISESILSGDGKVNLPNKKEG